MNFKTCKQFNISELRLENSACFDSNHAGRQYICNRSKKIIKKNYYTLPMFDLGRAAHLMSDIDENGKLFTVNFKSISMEFKIAVENSLGDNILLNVNQNLIWTDIFLNPNARALIISTDQPVYSLIEAFCTVRHTGSSECSIQLLNSYCMETQPNDNITACVDDIKVNNRRNNAHTRLFDPIAHPAPVNIEFHYQNKTYFFSKGLSYESSRKACLYTNDICKAGHFTGKFCAKFFTQMHEEHGINTLSSSLPFGRQHMFVPFLKAETHYSMDQIPTNYQTSRFRITYLVLSKVLPYRTPPGETSGINNEQERILNGWGKNADVIFSTEKNLFRALLILFNDDIVSEKFRPCLQWLVSKFLSS